MSRKEYLSITQLCPADSMYEKTNLSLRQLKHPLLLIKSTVVSLFMYCSYVHACVGNINKHIIIVYQHICINPMPIHNQVQNRRECALQYKITRDKTLSVIDMVSKAHKLASSLLIHQLQRLHYCT